MGLESATRIESLPAVTHAEWQSLAHDQLESFLREMRALSDDEWDKPTDCERWSVKDVTSHLLGWAEGMVSPREAAHQLRAGWARRHELGSALNGQNEVQVDERRHLSADQRIARFEEFYPRFLKLRRRMGGRAGSAIPIYYPIFGMATLSFLMNTIFSRDMLAHRIDIAGGVGRPLARTGTEDRIVQDCLRDWARRTRAQIRIELQGIGEGIYQSGEVAVATVRAEGTDTIRVLATRLDPGKLDIDGDRAAAEKWLAVGCPF